jgi:hypothetical protein
MEILGPDIEDLSWTPGLSPSASEAELDDIFSAPRRGYLYLPRVSKPFDYLFDRADEFDAFLLQLGADGFATAQAGGGIVLQECHSFGAGGDQHQRLAHLAGKRGSSDLAHRPIGRVEP